MGDPKKTKKKYIRPRKPWNKARLDEERTTKETYGLKNKKELWVIEGILKNKRNNARKLLALDFEKRLQREKELIDSLKKIGLVKENASLDDILGLKIEELLERRLETIVWRKGMANTPKQARQFIVHGHIAVNGKKVSTPSYMVKTDEENKIKYYKKELKLKQKEDKKKAFEETKPEEKTETKKETVKEDKPKKEETAKTENETKKEITEKKKEETKPVKEKIAEKKDDKEKGDKK